MIVKLKTVVTSHSQLWEACCTLFLKCVSVKFELDICFLTICSFFLGEIRRKTTPTGTLIMPAYVMSRPSFRVCAFTVYLSAACVRECAFAGATLPVSPDTCFLSAWASSCGHQTETLWSRSHCFLYDCLRGRFPPTIDFIMSVTLSLTSGALYVCHFFIITLLWLSE